MKKLVGFITAAVLVSAGSAMAGIDNANVTSYTATCTGLGTATSVRIERSLDASSNSGAGVAFHIVGTNQIVLFAGPRGLEAKANAICTITAINGESVEPFLAPIVILKSSA